MVAEAVSHAGIWTLFMMVCSATTDGPVTTIPQGTLEGKYLTTRGGRQVAAFLTIPYAEPPVELLRFKPGWTMFLWGNRRNPVNSDHLEDMVNQSPRPAKPWGATVYKADSDTPLCIQTGSNTSSEDCLYLNVFTPNVRLFRAAILDSKTALANSGFQLPGAQRHYVDLIAENTKCPREPAAFVDCLRELPEQEFIRLMKIIIVDLIPSMSKIGTLLPVIEPPNTPDRLIYADPILLNTDLPLFVTNAEKEGLLVTKPIFQDKTNQSLDAFNSNPTILLPYYLQFDDTDMCPESVARTVKKFYLQNIPINRDSFLCFVEMFFDAHYNYGTVLASRANKNTTFFSRLLYRGLTFSSSDEYYYGVSHSENLLYIFPYEAVRNITITHPDDIRFSKLYVKL